MTTVAERTPTRSGRRTGLRGLKIAAIGLGVLLGVLTAAAAVLATLSKPIDGHSMQPTLHDGDRVLTTPGSSGKADRFDVVILTEHGGQIVKRVIAVPGDRVEIVATRQDPYQVLLQKGGTGPWYRVEVPAWTGQAHSLDGCCAPDGTKTEVPQAQTVPAGRFFYLGDNPDVSADSRKYGWGDLAAIVGRVGLRTWPLTAPRGVGGQPALVPVEAPAGG